MPYESIDALQRALTRDVFHYAKDAKKAAGRALGTLVESIDVFQDVFNEFGAVVDSQSLQEREIGGKSNVRQMRFFDDLG